VIAGRTSLALLAGIVAAMAAVGPASAQFTQTGPEVELAERYAPVVRLQEQGEDCGEGEPFQPTDVELLCDNEDVAHRGPWDATNIVEVAPSADDLTTGKFDYHLDFPGDALEPGCTYDLWSKRLNANAEPTIYARVVSEEGRPGIALQYWFFYVFNDFNNLHEGDWEMIQLVFDAEDASEALGSDPVETGYSQHEGAERAEWDDEKLELVEGTHPVVYPAAGSHANYYEPALFLGRSAAQGVGCDDTTGPSRVLRTTVASVPSDPDEYLAAYPWLGYQGRWGELQRAFYNGPTGPNLKTQWTTPITWAEEGWRDQSFAIPAGRSIGPNATEFFCEAVAAGSNVLTQIVLHGFAAILVLIGVIVLLLWAASRTQWESSAPLRVARRRAFGQIVAAAWRMYWGHRSLFFGIGLLFVPVFVVVALIQWLIFELGLGALVDTVGESNGFLVSLVLSLTIVFTVFALGVVQAATARTLVELDAGHPVTALSAYVQLRGNLKGLLGALLRAVAIVFLLQLTVVGIPLAVWLIVRWSLLAQVIALEDRAGFGALHRSAELVRGHWFRVAAFTLLIAGAGLLAGPLLGVGLLFATDAAFTLVIVISSLLYAIAMR
jgi:hypothetical protein